MTSQCDIGSRQGGLISQPLGKPVGFYIVTRNLCGLMKDSVYQRPGAYFGKFGTVQTVHRLLSEEPRFADGISPISEVALDKWARVMSLLGLSCKIRLVKEPEPGHFEFPELDRHDLALCSVGLPVMVAIDLGFQASARVVKNGAVTSWVKV